MQEDTLNNIMKRVHCNEMSDSEVEAFKYRLNYFKEWCSKEFPEFTMEELVKIYRNWIKLKAMFSWEDIYEFMAVINMEE